MSLLRCVGVWALLGPGVAMGCTLLWATADTPGWLLIGFALTVSVAAIVAGERFDAWWVARRARRKDSP